MKVFTLFFLSLSSVVFAAKPVQITLGEEHTCARHDDGGIKCWGSNREGQLGAGSAEKYIRSQDAVFVNLGAGKKALQVSAGHEHTCAILDDETVRCWGNNRFSMLGLDSRSENSVGDAPDEMGDKLQPVKLPKGVTPVSLAVNYTGNCVLSSEGEVYCWTHMGPQEEQGKILKLAYTKKITQVTLGIYFGCALAENGQVFCWGTTNDDGKIGHGKDYAVWDIYARPIDQPVALGAGRKAVKLAGAGLSTCALLDDGSVKCWGRNNEGQLGQGDKESRGFKPDQMGDNLKPIDLGVGELSVTDMACGIYHCCAVFLSGTAKCWGSNSAGQLGHNPLRESVGGSRAEMGESLPYLPIPPRTSILQLAGYLRRACALLDSSDIYCFTYAYSGNQYRAVTERVKF